VLPLLFVAVVARADSDTTTSTNESRFLPWEKGSITLGGYVATFNSTLAVGLQNQPGVKINGEDQLGLKSTLTVFRVDAMYRPGDSLRNQLDFYYARYHRSATTTLASDITIGGITYPVGATAETTFNFDILRGSYSYAFLQTEQVRIALGLGAYVVPLRYSLQINTGGGFNAVEAADTTLPLPAVALRTEFQIIPRLFLSGSVDAMYLEISSFRGSLIEADVDIEYRIWKHFALGTGYSYTSVNVDAEGSNSQYPGANFVGSVDVHYAGWLAYGKFTF
jgi:hypothetical protein